MTDYHTTLTRIQAACGLPNPADACRVVLDICQEALHGQDRVTTVVHDGDCFWLPKGQRVRATVAQLKALPQLVDALQ
ncbi:MAG TPA: hypothetical protein VM537_16540, partial [Anaerolineae bacterium]|nr:hypothetical protein [Anaerolineae bacterium]